MKINSLRPIRRVRAALVVVLLVAGCARAALAQDRPGLMQKPARIPTAATPSQGNGGSGGQNGSARQISVPVVRLARPGQSGGAGNTGGGITGVTRVTRLSGSNQNARDFFRSSGLRLP